MVYGPAGSGKTGRLVDHAARRYQDDRFASTLVLVPTARHGDQFRRRLVAESGVALNLDVSTLAQYARLHAAGLTLSRDVAADLLRRVSLERIASGGAGRFEPIAEKPGLHALIAEAVAELVAADVEPAAFAEAASKSGSADLGALGDIYDAYRRALAERGWRDPGEAPSLAAEAIEGGPGLPGLVLVDSFEFLNPREQSLVAALADRTRVLVAIDREASERARWTASRLEALAGAAAVEELASSGGSAAVSAHRAFDPEAQLRGIARAIKQRLGEEDALRPSDVAVAFRQASQHLALARRVFAEYELPFDPAAGERLASRPFGTWVLALLRLPAHDWRLTRLAELLRSAFLDRRRWGIEGDTVDHLLRIGRRRNLLSGLEQLERLPRALEREAERAEGDGRAEYAARLRAARDGLEQSHRGAERPARRRGPSGGRVGGGARYRPVRTGRPRPRRRRGLREPRGRDGGAARRPRRAARDRRAARGDVAHARGLRRGAGAAHAAARGAAARGRRRAVRADAHAARAALRARLHRRPRGRRVPRAAPGRPPARSRGREHLAEAGLDLPPEPRSTEDELWRSASTRADTGTSLWRPRFDDSGRPVPGSWYFDEQDAADEPGSIEPPAAASQRELAVTLSSRWQGGERRRPTGLAAWPVVRTAAPIEQRRRSFEGAGRHEGALTGGAPERLVGPEVRWSATRVETYRTCAFQFFGRYGLELYEVEDERSEADAAIRGTVIHEIMEAVLGPLVEDDRPLVPATEDEAVRRMRELGRELWLHAPDEHHFGRAALWRLGWEDTADDLERLIRREAKHNEAFGTTRVAGLERRIDIALPGVEPELRLQGNIDRVDVGPGFAQIVDYKSGRAISRRAVESGDRLQLQLYALAAREEFRMERLIARYAYLDPRAEEWALDSANPADAELIEDAARHTEAVRSSVAGGDFRVNPQVPTCPSYCDFRHVCRVNQFTRSKWT